MRLRCRRCPRWRGRIAGRLHLSVPCTITLRRKIMSQVHSMLVVLLVALAFAFAVLPTRAQEKPATQPGAASVLDYTVKDIDGNEKNLSDYKGKAVLIVNVASKCGYTKQY